IYFPSNVSWGELYQGLQQDVVDSSENAYPFFVQESHHTTPNGKYITETAHDDTTRCILTNGETFDNYSKEHEERMQNDAEESVKAERKETKKQDKEYKEKAIEDGAIVNEIDRQPFIDIAKPIQDDYAEEIGVKGLLQKIRALDENDS